jgi:hypothetical protein
MQVLQQAKAFLHIKKVQKFFFVRLQKLSKKLKSTYKNIDYPTYQLRVVALNQGSTLDL